MAKEKYNHSYKEIIDSILECLDCNKEDKFNTLIAKKLKVFRDEYPDEVIIEIIKNEGWKIKNKNFDTQTHKILYFFAIIKNNIFYYNKKYNEKKLINEKLKLQNENNFIDEEIINVFNNKQKTINNRDITSILEDF